MWKNTGIRNKKKTIYQIFTPSSHKIEVGQDAALGLSISTTRRTLVAKFESTQHQNDGSRFTLELKKQKNKLQPIQKNNYHRWRSTIIEPWPKTEMLEIEGLSVESHLRSRTKAIASLNKRFPAVFKRCAKAKMDGVNLCSPSRMDNELPVLLMSANGDSPHGNRSPWKKAQYDVPRKTPAARSAIQPTQPCSRKKTLVLRKP